MAIDINKLQHTRSYEDKLTVITKIMTVETKIENSISLMYQSHDSKLNNCKGVRYQVVRYQVITVRNNDNQDCEGVVYCKLLHQETKTAKISNLQP